MKTTAIDIRQYFEPVFRTRPWKARLGIGSFLTFEFGRHIKDHGHIHGEWHLWIYLSKWMLYHGERKLVDSDADRRIISASLRRLEEAALIDIRLESQSLKTTFVFDHFRLVVSPADYLDDTDNRDHYWLFFMPQNEVLTVGPSGIRVERSDTAHDA